MIKVNYNRACPGCNKRYFEDPASSWIIVKRCKECLTKAPDFKKGLDETKGRSNWRKGGY